jgi:hypothetical protein
MTTIAPPRTPVTRLRRVIVAVIIVAFGLAAVGGIVVLLGGELGETALRVIGTTVVVGASSVAVLCCAALLGRRLQPVGVIGVVIAALAGALVVWTVWYRGDYGALWEIMSKITGTAVTVSAALALSSLLLLLGDRRRAVVRIGLVVTLALFAVVTALVMYLIWMSGAVDDQIFPRVLGIAAILAALGAVVVPVMSLLLPDERSGTLSHTAVSRLQTEASRRGISPDALVDALLAASPASSSQEDR